MKRIMRKATRDENGNVLIMVLALLVVGGLVLTPLLGLMSTGLVAGQTYEKKMAELYAADAGIEKALWSIGHQDPIPTEFDLEVNQKQVRVTMAIYDAQAFIAELLGLDVKNWVHSDWVVVGRPIEPGVVEISIDWNGKGGMWLTDVGVWLSTSCDYVVPQEIIEGDLRYQYPSDDPEPRREAFGGGTAFIWTWDNKDKFRFDKDTPTQTITFRFTPATSPELVIGFTKAGRENVGLTTTDDFAAYRITATAHSDDGSATTVVARATHACDKTDLTILSWTIV